MRTFRRIMVAVFLVAILTPAWACNAVPPTPTAAIRELDDMLDDFRTGSPLSSADKEFNTNLKRRIIHGTFDIRELAQLALAHHWKERSEAEHDQFVNLLIELLEERALFAKEQSAVKGKGAGKYRVMYQGEQYLDAAKTRALVKTRLFLPSENLKIALSYRLKRHDQQWKIYDIIVDDASLVENYRYQFHSIISKNSYDELVRRMTKKLEEIKAQRHAAPSL